MHPRALLPILSIVALLIFSGTNYVFAGDDDDPSASDEDPDCNGWCRVGRIWANLSGEDYEDNDTTPAVGGIRATPASEEAASIQPVNDGASPSLPINQTAPLLAAVTERMGKRHKTGLCQLEESLSIQTSYVPWTMTTCVKLTNSAMQYPIELTAQL